MSDDLLPLFDADAEAGVLAAFITRPDSRRKIVAEIHPQAIAYPPYAAVWSLLQDMHAAGETIDPGTLRREVQRRGVKILDAELVDLFRQHTSDAATDVARVVDWYRRRWTVERIDAMRASVIDPSADFMSDLHRFTGQVDKLVRRTGVIAARPGGFERLEARIEGMIDGTIKNLAWPHAPCMTRFARPLESGSILMLGGPPGDGKSFWLMGSMVKWIEAGERPVVCMLEKTDDWHLTRALGTVAANPNISRSDWYRPNEGPLDPVRAEAARASLRASEKVMRQLAARVYEARDVGDTLPDIGRWIDAQAEENNIVIVDPISLADAGQHRHTADGHFVRGCIRTCERTNARIILVTHPNSTQFAGGGARLASLMGGLVYQRQTDSVLYIEKHDQPKRYEVCRWLLGQPIREYVAANRTVSAFKARNGGGGGKKYAFFFDPDNTTMVEQGVIVKELKGDDGGDDSAGEGYQP